MPSARRQTPDARRHACGVRCSAHIAAAALCVLTLAAAFPAGAQRPGPGTPAPDFTLRALDSTTVRLAAFRGHPVIINFWATYCPPCIQEMPALGDRFRARRADSLVVLAINSGDEKERAIRRFTADMALPFPVLLDPGAKTADAFDVRGLPVTLFVDTAGVVRYRRDGPIQPGQLDAGLQAVIPNR